MSDKKIAVRRNKLNNKQLSILNLLVKFRYTTVPLLAAYLGVRKEPFNRTMRILVEAGYVVRVYENSYRIHRKPAIYYLSREGMKYIRKNTDTDAKVLRALYKNSTASEAFVQHQLNVHAAINWANNSYANLDNLYGKTELRQFAGFSTDQPDLVIKQHGTKEEKWHFDLLEVCDNPMMFISKKRLQRLITLIEDELDTLNIKSLLLVLPDRRTEKTFRRHATRILDDAVFDTIPVSTTTLDKIASAEASSRAWNKILLPD